MNIELFARNLLIRKQAAETVKALESAGVETVLLKGAALMEISPEYSFEREVEDIDILIKPGFLGKALDALLSFGYSHVPQDPYAFSSARYPVPVDLCEGLWYLNKEENDKIFDCAVRSSNFRILPPDEFLIQIYAHSMFHHARKEKKWERDMEILKTAYGGEIDFSGIESKLERRGLKQKKPPVALFYFERNSAKRAYNEVFIFTGRNEGELFT